MAADTSWGAGSRRRKIGEYLRAANELRQSYTQSHSSGAQSHPGSEDEDDYLGIPGAFPEVQVARDGKLEMLIVPSYARRHTQKTKPLKSYPSVAESEQGTGDAEYWRKEWEEWEDANAVIDVDVRGWVYTPHRGALNRKNRLLLGVARQLSGIPAPPAGTPLHGAARLQAKADESFDRIAEREAQKITEDGQREVDVAQRGGFSEDTGPTTPTSSAPSSRPASPHPGNLLHPLTTSSLQDCPNLGHPPKSPLRNSPTDMSPAELAVANSHLLRRLNPFFAMPAVHMPLTIFYYNKETSQSRTTTTNEYGHFNFRAALNFVPTSVRVLLSSGLSSSVDICITEPGGVSLVSDIDDTVKHSAIGSGAREIFRNAFIRDFSDLTIEGVKEWYSKMFEMGVQLHYLSNSPWQMFPLLVSFFARAGLPPGSFHLKQYSGMLQGIFEPVAERKKGTLHRIMNDFPDRRFIMVGDSGEADLELYTETALAFPGRILAIFIRDVTSPPSQPIMQSRPHRRPSSRAGSKAGSKAGSRASSRAASPTASPRRLERPQTPTSASPRSWKRPLHPARSKTYDAAAASNGESDDLMTFSSDEDKKKSRAKSYTPPVILEDAPRRRKSSKPGPPPPVKPQRLRSPNSTAENLAATKDEPEPPSNAGSTRPVPAIPPKLPKRLGRLATSDSAAQPESATELASRESSLEPQSGRNTLRSRVAQAYNALPSAGAYLNGMSLSRPSSPRSATSPANANDGDTSPTTTASPTKSRPPPPLPPRRGLTAYPAAAAHYASQRLWNGSGGDASGPEGSTIASGGTTGTANGAMNRKEELWWRRWMRAQDLLKEQNIVLRMWRKGQDVMDDALELVERTQIEGLTRQTRESGSSD